MGAEVDTPREVMMRESRASLLRRLHENAALMRQEKAVFCPDVLALAEIEIRALLARAEAAELRAAEAVVALNNRDRERMQAEREARNAEAQRDAAIAERDQARETLEALLLRLDLWEFQHFPADAVRDWCGHVLPAIARARAALGGAK